MATRIKSSLTLLALAALLASAPALAGTIHYSGGFVTLAAANDANESSRAKATDLSSAYVNLPGFNSALGVLTGVSVYFDSNWLFSNTVGGVDFGAVSAEGHGKTTMTAKVITPYSSQTTSYDKDSECWGILLCADADIKSGSFAGTLFPSGGLSSLDAFLSNITLQFTNTVVANLKDCGHNDHCSDLATNKWWGKASVKYTYDGELSPVPIPGAIWLFGSGLLILAGFNSRKRHRKPEIGG